MDNTIDDIVYNNKSSNTIFTKQNLKKHSFLISGLILFVLFIIIILVIVFYHNHKKKRHYEELNRIAIIEYALSKRKQEISDTRAKTLICPHGNYDNARDCYIKSNHKCHWNVEADRCNLI